MGGKSFDWDFTSYYIAPVNSSQLQTLAIVADWKGKEVIPPPTDSDLTDSLLNDRGWISGSKVTCSLGVKNK